VKDENGDLADFHSILNRRKNYFFFQLINVHGVNDIRGLKLRLQSWRSIDHQVVPTF
jgi:hypothetical protein